MHLTNGLASGFAPQPDAAVRALTSWSQGVYAGGDFVTVAGILQPNLACLGALEAFADAPPSLTPFMLEFERPSPNPAPGITRLAFTLPRAARVRIGIFDLQGRLVAEPLDAMRPPGRHSLEWDARECCPHGFYFVRLQTLGQTLVRRVILLP